MRAPERTCWILAALCVLPWAAATGGRSLLAQTPLAVPQTTTASAPASVAPVANALVPDQTVVGPVMTEWSNARRSAFGRLVEWAGPVPIATLRSERFSRGVPVYAGVSEFSMTIGAGHLSETSAVGSNGHIAITAHRDGTFRALKDMRVGDTLELEVEGTLWKYRISRTLIVAPEDTEILAPTRQPTLTLITCYPFFFVGKAPQRYIVQAELALPITASHQPPSRNQEIYP